MDLASEARLLLDKAQSEFLGANPDRDRVVTWANACLNSACGPIEERAGHLGVWGLLKLWVDTVERKLLSGERNGSAAT